MNTVDFDYELPPELIAQYSVEPRDHSRLMVVDRAARMIEHKHFFDIADYLRPGDLLVWNNSRVFKARLYGKLMTRTNSELWEHKRDIELFLVRPRENDGVWQVLAKPGRHVQMGMRVVMADDFYCDVLVVERDGTILVQFPYDEARVRTLANEHGHIPIPPYVGEEPKKIESYQTVYAKHEGSVAAPTAGFHFTEELIEQLKKNGVEFAEVTLHVGLGTFLPVKTDIVEEHKMHSEWVEVTDETAAKIHRAKAEGRRVIAVGTTTVRTLEGVAAMHSDALVHAYRGELNIFITPGYEFRVIDAMITNFHLPKSTLLMLVSAFTRDREFMLDCYTKAVAEQYRFFSFGDAMFLF